MNCFVKETYGVIWHFYHNSHGICYCKMRDENIAEYQVLIPDGREDFDVLVDDSDCIHLVFQNTEGDVVYVNHFDGKWRRATLLQSKKPTNYKKNFVLKRVNNWLNLFYCIEYNGKKMLTHQIIENTDSTPQVVDCIKDNFCVEQDSAGNLYLLFNSESAKTWGIKKYVWSKKEWSDFSPIEEIGDCNNAFLYIDNEDKTHILYTVSSCVMEYLEGETKMVGIGANPMMICQNKEIIMWEGIADNKIYLKSKEDNTPTILLPGGFSKPSRFRLRYTSSEPSLKAEACFGSIINGTVRTYGVNNFFVVAEKPQMPAPSEAGGDTLYNEIQKIKIQLAQLGRIVERLQTDTEKEKKIL